MDRSSSKIVLFMLIGVILLVLIAVGAFLASKMRIDRVSEKVRDGSVVSVLLVLHDDDDELVFSEVVLVHKNAQRLGIFDIPADLGTIVPAVNRVDSLETLFRLNDHDGYREAVAELIGQDIDYYMVFSKPMLQEIVDLTGGLEVFIPDPIRNLQEMVLLPGGNVELDGDKLTDYLMYERDMMTDQEEAVRSQTVAAKLLFSLAAHERIYQDHPEEVLQRVATDMDRSEMTAFFSFVQQLDPDSMIRQRVLGTYRSVEVEGETAELLFPHFEGKLLQDTLRQVEQTLERGEAIARGEVVRLQLLNGTRRTGLAARTRELFEGYGYQVVQIGNAPSMDYQQTVVYDMQNSVDTAEAVANIINARRVATSDEYQQMQEAAVVAAAAGDGESNSAEEEAAGETRGATVTDPDTDVDIDVTIVLGSDFDGWKVRN